MANMPFKLSYSFEGDFRRRPEQNLSGSSRKETRELLINRAHEERQKRQEERLKLKSTLTLQSFARSYLIRKMKKHEQRLEFDEGMNLLNLKQLLGKLLFFYSPNIDNQRLLYVSEKLLQNYVEINNCLEIDDSLNWLIRRFLCLNIKGLSQPSISKISLQCISAFTENTNSMTKITIWPYLVSKGYFEQLRSFIDHYNEDYETVLMLICRPFEYLPFITTELSNRGELIISEFCRCFLTLQLTPFVKDVLIPHLQSWSIFPYNKLVNFLNRAKDSHKSIFLNDSGNLLYCLLALEPADHVPNKDILQLLALLSINLNYTFYPGTVISDDSDNDEVEGSLESTYHQNLIKLLNHTNRVKKIISFVEKFSDDTEVFIAVVRICHNLLLTNKDAIRTFMLPFMLAFKGTFLITIWQMIKKQITPTLQTFGGGSLGEWSDTQTCISVFCDMFIFYTETLTDSETSNTSGTFTDSDLFLMSELLRNLSLHLIEVAYPMCRSSSTYSTPEILHLYNSCFGCVKMLYNLDLRNNFCKPGFWTRKKIHISQDLSKKNYLSKRILPFYGLVHEDEDEHLPPLSTIELRSLAILQKLPFLIEFNTRVLLLRDLCRYSLNDSESVRSNREFFTDSPLVIRRTHLYEDAFEKLTQENETDLRHKIRIQFINNAGLEEAGIDGGGIFKEFTNELVKTSFDPNRGFFLLTNDNALYPNPNVGLLFENFTEHYYFIGRLVGKAIFENILLDLPLAEFFLVKLLIDRANAYYLKSLDPVLYKNILFLRDFCGDVQELGLDFTTIINDLGETKVVELIPNGSNIPVTNDNRLEYIHRLANFKLNIQIKKQCHAFREGLNNVVPLLWLRLFNHLELQVIIGGDTQEMDISDLMAHTSYGGEFSPDHSTISLFWRIVQKFTGSQKKQLLKFVTSCSRPPLLGFKELNPPFCIQSSGTQDRMPSASTCLNLLKLPVIKDEETLRNKLLSAIEQQAGFELS